MVKALGSGYVIEYCISALLKEKRAERYQNYMSDAGYLLTNGFYTAHGAEEPLKERFVDKYIPKERIENPEEKAGEIINRIRNGLKGL